MNLRMAKSMKSRNALGKKNEWECLTFNFDHVFVNHGLVFTLSGQDYCKVLITIHITMNVQKC